MARLGFLGLGRMGWPMAARLAAAGHALAVADAAPGRAEAFAAAHPGVRAASGPADCAGGAEMLLTILPTSAEVAEVAASALPALAPGALWVDMTSGHPARTREIAASLAGAGVRMVDCAVSGGVARAETGELALMAGGADADLDAAAPVLAAMGSSLHRCGPLGAGHAMKALNNLVSAGGFLIAVEALLIGQRFGLDPARMVEVLNASTGMNNSTQKKLAPFVLSRRFDSGFGLDLMVKDLSIALSVGQEGGVPAPFAALCREMWAAAAAQLGPGQDHTAIARLSERLAGEELGPRAG